MNLIKYIILGIIQGITEPIPISSSGHLVIFNSILRINYDIDFLIFANFGSFIAIFMYYKDEIFNIIKDFFLYIKYKKNDCKTNYNYALNIVISTIPIGIIGLFLKDAIDKYTTVKIVGISLIITAIMLYMVKDIKGYKKKKEISIIDSIVIGLLQIIALIPGISRSGTTLALGLSRKIDKIDALNYSFMLYIPISIASMILSIKDIFTLNKQTIILYIIGMIFSYITTYYSIRIFKKIVINNKLIYFIYYCLIMGIITLLFI